MSSSVGDMSAAESPLMDLDPDRPWIVFATGRKGSGKSVLNRQLFRSFPYDRVCIDVNGNADCGPETEDIHAPLPTSFPEGGRAFGEPRHARSLRFRANPADKSYREHLDQAVALALFPQHRRTALWAGEVGELQPHGNASPHMRLALQQNRHHNTTLLFDGPRPMNLDPLTIAQADLVAVFDLPAPQDRKRVADCIGFPPKLFDQACHSIWRTGEHHFALWSTKHKRLYHHEPLPVGDEEKGAAA